MHAETSVRLQSLQRAFEGVVAASENSNADDEHDPEGSTIAYERSQLTALLAQARAHLTDIEQARHRIERGDYDRCVVCRRGIPVERLEARPTARTCIACAPRR